MQRKTIDSILDTEQLLHCALTDFHQKSDDDI